MNFQKGNLGSEIVVSKYDIVNGRKNVPCIALPLKHKKRGLFFINVSHRNVTNYKK